MQNVPSNRLLKALPPSCAERLIAAATLVDLPQAMPLFGREEEPRFLYLLTSGIASVVFISVGGTGLELATQGAEGLTGWDRLFGPLLDASTCNVQVAGAGYRIPFATIQREFDTTPELRQRVLEYAQHQNIASNQIAACNRLHRAEARFVRWLLMVSDRLGSNDLAMTQEFLSNMLGTRRTTVAEVCAELGRAGGIEGRRGGLRILNRAILEARVCECYPILRARYDALYNRPTRLASKPG